MKKCANIPICRLVWLFQQILCNRSTYSFFFSLNLSFPGHSLTGLLFITEEQEKVGMWHNRHSWHTCWPCLWHQRHRLVSLGTICATIKTALQPLRLIFRTHCVKPQSLIQSRIRLECSGSAQKQRIVLWSCHCEALMALLEARRSTSVHINKIKKTHKMAVCTAVFSWLWVALKMFFFF